jgi:hypothetical protein
MKAACKRKGLMDAIQELEDNPDVPYIPIDQNANKQNTKEEAAEEFSGNYIYLNQLQPCWLLILVLILIKKMSLNLISIIHTKEAYK